MRRLFLVLLLLCGPSRAASAQTVEHFRLSPARPEDATEFGAAVALAGEWAFVGDPNGRDRAGVAVGTCTVYRRSAAGWAEHQVLRASLGIPELFAYALAATEDDLVIGARAGGEDFFGRVFVYRREGDVWRRTQELREPDGGLGHAFGGSVALSGDTLVVGAYGRKPQDLHEAWGAGYVYHRASGRWDLAQVLRPPSTQDTVHSSWSFFGWSCALEHDLLVLGAPSNAGMGMAFVYRRGPEGFRPAAQLTLTQYPPDRDFLFGYSVAVSGRTIAVGAPVPVTPLLPGFSSAWIYAELPSGEWTRVASLRASDHHLTQGTDRFGCAVALSGGTLLVGAERGSANGPLAGAAYRFRSEPGGWHEVEELIASDPTPPPHQGGAFGGSLAFDPTHQRILVGARDAWIEGTSTYPGSAYVFDRNLGRAVCGGRPNSTGAGTVLTLGGDPNGAEALDLSAYHATPGAWGLFVFGPGTVHLPLGARGLLCATRPTVRAGPPVVVGPSGSAMCSLDLERPPALGRIVPGTSWVFQFVHTDRTPSGVATWHTSEAMRFAR